MTEPAKIWGDTIAGNLLGAAAAFWYSTTPATTSPQVWLVWFVVTYLVVIRLRVS